jgi:hypothetical protein
MISKMSDFDFIVKKSHLSQEVKDADNAGNPNKYAHAEENNTKCSRSPYGTSDFAN